MFVPVELSFAFTQRYWENSSPLFTSPSALTVTEVDDVSERLPSFQSASAGVLSPLSLHAYCHAEMPRPSVRMTSAVSVPPLPPLFRVRVVLPAAAVGARLSMYHARPPAGSVTLLSLPAKSLALIVRVQPERST